MKKDKLRFVLKCFLLALPFIVILIFYFANDPFMVLKPYKRYGKSYFSINESLVGWQTYMNYRDSLHYNSFIMGNSCTMGFRCSDWEKHLDKNDKAMRFYGDAESLIAIKYKLKALDSHGGEIKNLLLLLDRTTLEKTVLKENSVHILPPAISGISNSKYQFRFLQTFLIPKYLISYIDYSLFHKERGYMRGIINPYGETIRDPYTCELNNPREKMIEDRKDQYWLDNAANFPPRKNPGKEDYVTVFGKEKEILEDIASICRRHNTNVVIVINPNYQQVKINDTDYTALKDVFGEKNVFDFSGINEYSANIENFYDDAHYRPILGRVLLEHIYHTENN